MPTQTVKVMLENGRIYEAKTIEEIKAKIKVDKNAEKRKEKIKQILQ